MKWPVLTAGFDSTGLKSQLPWSLRQEDAEFKVCLDYRERSCSENRGVLFSTTCSGLEQNRLQTMPLGCPQGGECAAFFYPTEQSVEGIFCFFHSHQLLVLWALSICYLSLAIKSNSECTDLPNILEGTGNFPPFNGQHLKTVFTQIKNIYLLLPDREMYLPFPAASGLIWTVSLLHGTFLT